MSIVVRLPDDVINLIEDVKLNMLNNIEDNDDISFKLVLDMNRIDIIRHCLRTVKSFSGTTTEKHVTCDGNS